MVQSTFVTPQRHIATSEGFAPPSSGGTLAVMQGTFDYQDTSAKELFTLPTGAIPVDWWIDVSEDFDAGTDNDLDLGAGTDADYFAAAVDIGTQGVFRFGATGTVFGRVGAAFDEPTPVTATYAPSGTAAGAGEATVFMSYYLP